MNQTFELPIYYLENKKKLNNDIINDLELLDINDNNEERKSLLEMIIKPESKIGIENLNKLCEYYTNNKKFLKETQKLISNWEYDEKTENKTKQYDEFYDLWKNIKNDENFADRYYYIDIEFFNFLNNSSHFLQILSLYNLLSPVLTLIMPIILLLVPFFMLKMSGVPITLNSYYKVLGNIFSKHALGNIFTLLDDIPWEHKIYSVVSIVFYFFSIYQNSIVCYRFYKNFTSIHNDLFLMRDYLNTTITNMNLMEQYCCKYSTYKPFLESIYPHKELCIRFKNKLECITPLEMKKITTKCNQIGEIMKYFYEIHNNKEIEHTINFSLGFNAYMEHLNGFNNLRREKFINKCTFVNTKMKLENAFFPYLLENNPVKNTISLNKNIAITGPNASGKTTILKSILFNLILSQSFGYGFYSKAKIPLYSHIHCYLNIPDTSGRDSLFQAEARRCKEIMESLEDNEKHFCIFDELFSGTNPNEACASSYGFIKYLINKQNIDFVLTTHLLNLCEKINIILENNHMNVVKINDFDFKYTYKMDKGISDIKGGLKVLADLNYPEYILNESNKLLKSM